MARLAASLALLEVSLILLVTLLPLAYIPTLISLYHLPKQTFLALFAAMVLWLAARSASRQRGTVSLPLLLPVLAYAVITFLSVARAVNPYAGLVQAAQTVTGLGLFWATATVVADDRIRLRLFEWASLTGVVVSLIGIAQVWGLEIPTLIPTGGPGSTFGNVNNAAHYLVLILPVSYMLFFLAREGWETRLWAFAAAVMTTYLVYTGTRSAWAGTLLAGLVLLVFFRFKEFSAVAAAWFSRQKIWGLAVIFAFVVAMNIAPSVWIPSWGSSRSSAVARVAGLTGRVEPTSFKVRIAIWANTLAMFQDHPVLGVGTGNFPVLYPLYARRVLEDLEIGRGRSVREAHNDYLQLLAETGVLGFLAFAWILLALARRFIRDLAAARGQTSCLIGLAAAFGLLAFLFHAFFDFPFQRAVPASLFWILAGVLWRTSEPLPVDTPSRRLPSRAVAALVIGMACVATGSAAWGLNALRAEYHFSRGVWALLEEKPDESGRALRHAVSLNPFEERYFRILAVYDNGTGRYADAVHHIRQALALYPYHIASHNSLGVALLALGNVPEAIRAFDAALRIWPDYPEARHNLGLSYARLGQRDLAIAQFREILRLNPLDERARAALQHFLKGGNP